MRSIDISEQSAPIDDSDALEQLLQPFPSKADAAAHIRSGKQFGGYQYLDGIAHLLEAAANDAVRFDVRGLSRSEAEHLFHLIQQRREWTVELVERLAYKAKGFMLTGTWATAKLADDEAITILLSPFDLEEEMLARLRAGRVKRLSVHVEEAESESPGAAYFLDRHGDTISRLGVLHVLKRDSDRLSRAMWQERVWDKDTLLRVSQRVLEAELRTVQ